MLIPRFGRPEDGHVHPHPSEITPASVYADRRRWMRQAAALGMASAASSWTAAALAGEPAPGTAGVRPGVRAPLSATRSQVPGGWTMEPPNAYADITGYNNFYEFGTDKADPVRNARDFRTRPWTVTLEGLVRKPVTLDLDALLKLAPLEERIYRLRCVEGWSMVIPWVGYPLAELLKRAEPLGSAKYVQFVSLADPKQMPGLNPRVLEWPYAEGLRLDEAMHPLTLMALGLYPSGC